MKHALPLLSEINSESLPVGHFLFSSESVGEGHPDKLCDQISDAILDSCLKIDSGAKVDCQVSAKRNQFFVLGDIEAKGHLDIPEIVKEVIKNVGFDSKEKGLDYNDVDVNLLVHEKSSEEETYYASEELLEEDYSKAQGMMFGYATAEWDTETLLPLSHYLASKICERISECRKSGEISWLRPDCKSQVTVEYKKEGNIISPVRVHSVLISTQHDSDISIEVIRNEIIENVINQVIPDKYLDVNTTYYINPSKSFIVGGTMTDTGLTGRQITVDTYGGWAPYCDVSFSGKDPSNIGRSGAYYARYIAKSLVKNGLCHRVLIQLSYTMGMAEPLINIDTFDSAKEGLTEESILGIIRKNFNPKLTNIIEELQLKQPIYKRTAVFGHFGRCEPEFHWEVPKEELILE